MSLFKTEPKVTVLPDLTATDAKKIYDLLATGIDATTVFTKHGYKIKYTGQVIAEMSRLEALAVKTVRGNQSISKDALVGKLSSSLLDVAKVADDVVKYNPSFKDDRTYTDFKTEITATEA